MSWKEHIEDILGTISIIAFIGMVVRRVSTGIGSAAEQQLVENLKTVANEYKAKGLLEQKIMEADDLKERQRQFDEKWAGKPKEIKEIKVLR